jgi:DNA-binding transcriptional MocR family regulator
MKSGALGGLQRQLGHWSAGHGALYQKLASGFMRLIREGLLQPGARLPSERRLAEALTLSRTTVVAAYDLLLEAGWVERRPGSGTRVSGTSPVVLAARAAARATALMASPLFDMLSHDDHGLVDFALGAPLPLTGLELDRLELSREEYAAHVGEVRYHPLGLPALRDAIALRYTSGGLETGAEQVLVTTGAQQAINLCALAYLQRGDTVLVEDPTYFGALDAFRLAGARFASVPIGPRGADPALLRARIVASAPRLLYLSPTLQNPTGTVVPSAARQRIAALALETGVPIVEDATLAELAFDGGVPKPLAAYAPEAPIVTIGSLSKVAWPGLRIGWIRGPASLMPALARVKSVMDLGAPALTQAVAVRLLAHIDRVRILRCEQLRPRRDALVRLLRRALPEWTFTVPAGGLFLWVELPAGDAQEFAQVALRRGVVIVPGTVLSPEGRHARSMRLPFLAEPAVLAAGVDRLRAAWDEYSAAGARRSAAAAIAMV